MSNTSDRLEMSFWSHVDELRSRIIKSLLCVLVLSVVAYIISDWALHVLSAPIDQLSESSDASTDSNPNQVNLQVIKITSMFMVQIYISLIIGFTFSIPIILYQIWRFVSPAINKKLSFITFIMFTMSTLFFIIGAYFSYKIIIPLSISFFTSLNTNAFTVDYNITLENYLTYTIWMIFIGGLVFQLPIISIIFKKLGIIDHTMLKKGRRYAILGIFVFAALFTPPDPLSQVLFAIPLVVLYELSIIIIRFMK